MRQSIRTWNRVYKDTGLNLPIEVGDTLTLVLKDDTEVDVTVTEVADDAHWVSWDHTVTGTRKEDVKGVADEHLWSCQYYGGAEDPGIPDPPEWG